MNAVILQGANHLQTGAISHVREARVPVAAKISLQNAPVLCPIEHRTPGLEFAHAIGRFLGVELGHAPLIYILAAAHRVGEMHLPIVAIIHIAQRGRDAAFGHDGVRFAKERFANKPHRNPGRRCFNRSAQSRTTCPDHEHVVLDCLIIRHRLRKPSGHARHPSSIIVRRDRRTPPRTNSATPKAYDGG